jgi:hypothetical protein
MEVNGATPGFNAVVIVDISGSPINTVAAWFPDPGIVVVKPEAPGESVEVDVTVGLFPGANGSPINTVATWFPGPGCIVDVKPAALASSVVVDVTVGTPLAPMSTVPILPPGAGGSVLVNSGLPWGTLVTTVVIIGWPSPIIIEPRTVPDGEIDEV